MCNILQPKIVSFDVLGFNHIKIIIEPFERGYGYTVGNAFRRVLLSSITGYAPTEVIMPGILHEYSVVPGLKDDIINLLLNLKGIVFDLHGRDEVTVFLKKEKVGDVIADDISKSHDFTIINPNHVITYLSYGGKLDMQIKVRKGRGYVPGNMNDLIKNKQLIGNLILDASFSPIKFVNYFVENTRFGTKIDYDKLILEIKTNGVISPEEAIYKSTKILINQFSFFLSISNMCFDIGGLSSFSDRELIKSLLFKKIDYFCFSEYILNCLKYKKIFYVGDLVQLTEDNILDIFNSEYKYLNEIKKILSKQKIELGVEIKNWKLIIENYINNNKLP